MFKDKVMRWCNVWATCRALYRWPIKCKMVVFSEIILEWLWSDSFTKCFSFQLFFFFVVACSVDIFAIRPNDYWVQIGYALYVTVPISGWLLWGFLVNWTARIFMLLVLDFVFMGLVYAVFFSDFRTSQVWNLSGFRIIALSYALTLSAVGIIFKLKSSRITFYHDISQAASFYQFSILQCKYNDHFASLFLSLSRLRKVLVRRPER